MKILQLNVERTWRGGERQTLFCMQAFRDAGHEVELLAREGFPMAEHARADGFRVHAVRNVAQQLAFLAGRGRGYDIIHSQTANTVTWAVLTKPLHGRPVVFSRRTALSAAGHEWKTGNKWRRVDLLVAISEMAAAEPRRLGVEPVIIRSAVPPHATDTARAAAFAAEMGLAGRKVLATAAALIRDKDPLTLIRAVRLLADSRSDFVFVHLGGGGNREAEAHALVRELGLESVYLFAGFRKGVEDYYSLMDVYVMASCEEALGSSVLDAFWQRVPVVSTNAGGLAESVSNGRGVLCPVGDARALADGMARMLDDEAARAQAVERAYRYAQQEHEIGRMGQRYLAHFERLLQGNPRRS